MKKIFSIMRNSRFIERYDGWRAIICAGDYDYFSKKNDSTMTWTIDEDVSGQVELRLRINPNDEKYAYSAPEWLWSIGYDLYSFERAEYDVYDGNANVPMLIRTLEDHNMLTFSSVCISR